MDDQVLNPIMSCERQNLAEQVLSKAREEQDATLPKHEIIEKTLALPVINHTLTLQRVIISPGQWIKLTLDNSFAADNTLQKLSWGQLF